MIIWYVNLKSLGSLFVEFFVWRINLNWMNKICKLLNNKVKRVRLFGFEI